MKKNKLNIKGFTLVELIIVISLISIIMAVGFTLFDFGNKSYKLTNKEYQIQSEMRLASTKINNYVRYSTAIFTLTELNEDKLSEGWNYLAVSSDKKEIVEYVYNPVTKSHDRNVVVSEQEDLKYDLCFKKENPYYKDKLLKFTLSGTIGDDENSRNKITIDSEAESLNALQVVDRGSEIKPSKVLAYRNDDRPLAAEAAVTMVLDKSGSMIRRVNGSAAYYAEDTRIYMLRNEAKNLINDFSEVQNIQLSIVPFSTTANNSSDFKNAYENKAELIDYIDSTALDPAGGTNTGDGIRRAYYKIKDYCKASNSKDLEVKKYMIILVDGVTTLASVTDPYDSPNVEYAYPETTYKIFGNKKYLHKSRCQGLQYNYNTCYFRFKDYITDDRDIVDSGNDLAGTWIDNIWGYGNVLDEDGTEYVRKMGKMVTDDNIEVYVIGFSSLPEELDSLNDIANACGTDKIYKAGDQEQLSKVFNEIKKDIFKDLWHISGPQ